MRADYKVELKSVCVWYGSTQVLFDVDLGIPRHGLTAILGPSGSGKSTVLQCMNRMVDTHRTGRMQGEVLVDGIPVSSKRSGAARLRRRFGVVAQKPNPFPRSIHENVAYGVSLHRLADDKAHLDALVRASLARVGLWEEVKDRLDERATDLSVGQQHRLCIARALAYRPEIILVDEPVAGLDPAAAATIEEVIASLKHEYTLVVVTHHVDLARRVADHAVYLESGRLVEAGPAEQLLPLPRSDAERNFVSDAEKGMRRGQWSDSVRCKARS